MKGELLYVHLDNAHAFQLAALGIVYIYISPQNTFAVKKVCPRNFKYL